MACRQDLTAAKAAIEELFGKIREIRRKAEASEIMVQEICRDIRKLDFAKTHLTHTITALRRLAMLVNAVGAPPQPCAPSSTPDKNNQKPLAWLHLLMGLQGYGFMHVSVSLTF